MIFWKDSDAALLARPGESQRANGSQQEKRRQSASEGAAVGSARGSAGSEPTEDLPVSAPPLAAGSRNEDRAQLRTPNTEPDSNEGRRGARRSTDTQPAVCPARRWNTTGNVPSVTLERSPRCARRSNSTQPAVSPARCSLPSHPAGPCLAAYAAAAPRAGGWVQSCACGEAFTPPLC